MKKENYLIAVLLLICLWIYTFYRPDTILINEIWSALGIHQQFGEWKSAIQKWMSLPHWMIYNLPEALWIFCFSISAKSVAIQIKGRKYSLKAFPVIYAVFLEILQLLHVTNGTFDFWDIWVSILAWLVALYLPQGYRNVKSLLFRKDADSWRLILIFIIVLLAHFSGD